MYTASAAFHQAVQRGAPQRALLIFDDAFFTNEDINVEQGIEFTDTFNEETDLAIGQALSNQIRFTLFNDDSLLYGYEFGEFTATIGAKVSESTYKQRAPVVAISGSNTYYGNTTYPYLTRNGAAMSVTFPVHGIFILDDTVHVFGRKGYYAAFSDSTGASKSIATNAFMMNKASRLDNTGMYYNSQSRTMREYFGGTVGIYEFVPLGVFTAVRPNVAELIEIDFTCEDRMQLFDKDMPEDFTVSYPTTIQGLLNALCAYVNVPCGASGFINADAEIEEEPEAFKKATMRQVIAWIAEAACANARFDRDGVLRLVWLNSTGQTLTESNYMDFNPYWYEVPKVNKLYNRDTNENLESVAGSGTQGYLIQDNPLIALESKEFEITLQPQDYEGKSGDTVTFSVAAQVIRVSDGSEEEDPDDYTIEYQWQKKNLETGTWTDISGEDDTTLTVTATDDDDGSRYRCKITYNGRDRYSDGVSITFEEEEEDEEANGEGGS